MEDRGWRIADGGSRMEDRRESRPWLDIPEVLLRDIPLARECDRAYLCTSEPITRMTHGRRLHRVLLALLAILYMASWSPCSVSCGCTVTACGDDTCASLDDHADSSAGREPSTETDDHPDNSRCLCICQSPVLLPSSHTAAPIDGARSVYRLLTGSIPATADLPPPDHIPLA
jgi:hypothetical protein